MHYKNKLSDSVSHDSKNSSKIIMVVILLAIFIICVTIYLYKDKIKNLIRPKYGKSTTQSVTDNNKIDYEIIPMNHSTIEILTGISKPMSVIKNSQGQLYVSDFGDHSVKIFDSSLKLMKQIGSRGEETGNFYMPHAIDFNAEGQFYVTDYGNKRIQIFSPDGNYISTLKSSRDLVGPATAYFDTDYNLYVSDFGSGSIDKYSPKGNFMGWIGAKQDSILTNGWEINNEASIQTDVPGGFQRVHSVKFDKKGVMYIVDSGNNRIQRFTKEGIFLGWIGLKEDDSLTNGWEMSGIAKKSNTPGGFDAPIAQDFINEDELVVLEYGNPRMQRFSNEGKYIGWFGGTEDGGYTDGWKKDGLAREGTENGAFKNAYDLRVYGNKIFVADSSNSRIEIIEFSE